MDHVGDLQAPVGVSKWSAHARAPVIAGGVVDGGCRGANR